MSNCVVSMVSPDQYEEFVLPPDRALSAEYARFGVHTCNWVIDPYAQSLRKIERMGYLDTGMDSDLARVKRLFPDARRAVLYTPGEVEAKSLARIAADLRRVAEEYAPCDIVLADEPDIINALMDKGAEIAVERAKFNLERGIRILRLNDSAGNMNVISPSAWREFVFPGMRAGGLDGGFALGSGCALPRGTPAENLIAARDTALKYGIYRNGILQRRSIA